MTQADFDAAESADLEGMPPDPTAETKPKPAPKKKPTPSFEDAQADLSVEDKVAILWAERSQIQSIQQAAISQASQNEGLDEEEWYICTGCKQPFKGPAYHLRAAGAVARCPNPDHAAVENPPYYPLPDPEPVAAGA